TPRSATEPGSGLARLRQLRQDQRDRLAGRAVVVPAGRPPAHSLRRAAVPPPPGPAPAEQRHRTAPVAALPLAPPRADLPPALPLVALLLRSALPPALERLGGVERQALLQEPAAVGERLVRRRRVVVGHSRHARRPVRQGTAERVTRPGVARTALGISVSHRSGSGSLSQPSSSVSNTSGISSCGKWPAPSKSRHRYGAAT